MSNHTPSTQTGDDPGADFAFLERAIRFQDGAFSAEDAAKFEAELLADIKKQHAFVEIQVRSTAIHQSFQRDAFQSIIDPVDRQGSTWAIGRSWRLAATIVIAATAFASVWFRLGDKPKFVQDAVAPIEKFGRELNVRLAGASQAQFFGELAPEIQSVLAMHRDYVLTNGLVQLAFPSGASAIVEGPAVFRVLSAESLALDLGKCSVHAPDGAEGFRVETPVTRIVDRGTRFTVSVAETSVTDVQVIEGAADVYRQPDESSKTAAAAPEAIVQLEHDALQLQVRLTDREAKRFTSNGGDTAPPAEFSPGLYRRQLPDRVISYEATTAPAGGAEHLVSVTLQRGGQVRKYAVEELIPVELTWFKAPEARAGMVNLIGGMQLPERRRDWMSDSALNTGVINPGGQKEPLSASPVMRLPEDPAQPGTPGFAVRFRSPVVNAPGPDVVFFEVQCWANPVSGDAFHVSPLEMRPGRKSLTVREYDLKLTSPESLKAADFYQHKFAKPITSLAELETTEFSRSLGKLKFRVIGVAIDLSDLGFDSGETIDGLFFQDAQDDDHFVDPVYIAGLPAD